MNSRTDGLVGGSTEDVLDCELCVVGAGYAALNGLNAAAKYLPKGARVVLIDEKDNWGGTWTQQYEFVRLHQPYRLFTAGDQPWALRRDPSYLATRDEVTDHFASVPRVSAGHLQITTLFRHTYTGHRIRGGIAEVDAAPLEAARGAPPKRVRARRLLKATGLNIKSLPPLQLSSRRVRSLGICDPALISSEFTQSSAPVFIVGSGKTAMDCARHLIHRGRSVNVILGSGMWFLLRDTLFPGGRDRYLRGKVFTDVMLRVARHFDGWNEAAVVKALARDELAFSIFDQPRNFRLGIMSRREGHDIFRGVDDVHRGHLVDVEGTQMILREAGRIRRQSVPEGSWFINCTSHFRDAPHEPVLQDSGITCAPQQVLGFTGMAAYFVTHLWYRDELAQMAPKLFRFRFDVEPKLRWVPHSALVAVANLALIGERLPLSVHSRFRGDYNRWYPVYRQLPALARLLWTRGEMIAKAERLLRTRYSDSADSAEQPAVSQRLAQVARSAGPS